ncbi:hypothetical protein NE237_016075 [Protea cynaroides]|uniref:Uncharacterized protein n=1 Tax=Protea cynaroides TaxID=273540 RepID=A0A9Q0QRT7_9MAGN|nr:hypothetical protein NE237_016075 [Protea cynaroides]
MEEEKKKGRRSREEEGKTETGRREEGEGKKIDHQSAKEKKKKRGRRREEEGDGTETGNKREEGGGKKEMGRRHEGDGRKEAGRRRMEEQGKKERGRRRREEEAPTAAPFQQISPSKYLPLCNRVLSGVTWRDSLKYLPSNNSQSEEATNVHSVFFNSERCFLTGSLRGSQILNQSYQSAFYSGLIPELRSKRWECYQTDP